MEGINGLKVNALLVLVPNDLCNSPSVEEDVVDYRNNLFLEVGTLAHIVVKPTLG